MKIYTKTGDKGETSLFGGKRVSKSDLQIDAYGTVDELNSWIGLLRDQEISKHYIEHLLEIQDRLFTLGSHLASDPKKGFDKLPMIDKSDVEFLERKMDEMDASLPALQSFVLPGGNSIVSYCHLARCVCRRAERLVVALNEQNEFPEILPQYLNRLSDYLFVLSRALTQDLKAQEMPWNPRK